MGQRAGSGETKDEILATVDASAPRRVLAAVMLIVVGALAIYVALAKPPAPHWLVFLLAIGGFCLWLAMRLWQATALRIELTEEVLRSSDGAVIAEVADVVAVDRGVFAFKPSNGFLIRTATKGARSWRPGLWWRLGHRIGIGGVTPGAQSKSMAEILAIMIARREAGQSQS
ncbi:MULTISPECIES: hypothetical protein [Phaeobacter]|uniref:hypothetical protein n=1 Tax=Phaeobacter TaxID=302485 RepID=UPI00040EB42E|nr:MULTISPECIES: hypothetical protein [Phaeobacter]AUQ57806.1 hypothetical protein PhaeoP30_00872 [Phaeobacter inhibens]AUR02839.1 hypothetical protein PhaeoP72_00845 [Phaeobacter inhibens]AUR07090.1 hypothetical protein PhaeoP59_00895 [Phaeobacter inhibens]AUR10866.1 hypothetical protein PhaeoP48_00860 [Phaeobacter inhibens]KXF90984.1 hypothetical protein AT574_08905 [Phaeobacter inhibens]